MSFTDEYFKLGYKLQKQANLSFWDKLTSPSIETDYDEDQGVRQAHWSTGDGDYNYDSSDEAHAYLSSLAKDIKKKKDIDPYWTQERNLAKNLGLTGLATAAAGALQHHLDAGAPAGAMPWSLPVAALGAVGSLASYALNKGSKSLVEDFYEDLGMSGSNVKTIAEAAKLAAKEALQSKDNSGNISVTQTVF